MRIVVSVLISSLCLGAFGYSWQDFDGTGEWPTAGDIKIPNNVVITVDDEHVDAVAGWNNVYFGNSLSRLVFVNATKPATYNAADTCNNGALGALNSCELKIMSTNPNRKFTAGRYDFTNSNVIVASEYGLCPGSKANIYFTADGTLGNLRFRYDAWDEDGWTGVKAFTNHCTIAFNCDANYTAVVDKKMYIGSSAADEYFVQDADFFTNPTASSRYLRFRNNYEQVSGVFGTDNTYYGQHLWTSANLGAVIRFSGSTAIRCNSNASPLGWVALGSFARYCFNQTGGFHTSNFSPNIGEFLIGVDDVFHDTDASTQTSRVFSIVPYVHDNTTTTNRWDLQGHDVTISSLASANGGTKQDNTQFYVIRSDEPATLNIRSTVPKAAGTIYQASPCFEGQINVVIDNLASNRFANVISTSTGTLTVKSGSTLDYNWNGAWSGKIVVEDGGVLIFSSQKTLDTRPELVVEPGGKVVFNSWTYLRALNVNGVDISPYSYNLAQLREEWGISAEQFEGGDTINVNISYNKPFAGWPKEGEEGKVVHVPAELVYVGDADAEAVARTGKILLSWNSRFIFTNTTKVITLNADIFSHGYGYFEFKNSAGVILKGDNSHRLAGCRLTFENTPVTVAHRYGLGGPKSDPVTITYGPNCRFVTFKDPATKYFTNEVAIIVKGAPGGTVATTPVVFGSAAADEYLIQNADFTDGWTGLYAQRLCFTNNVEFLKGYGSSAAASTYMGNARNAVVRFGPTATFNGMVTAANPNGRLSLAIYNKAHPDSGEVIFANEQPAGLSSLMFNIAHVVLARDNPFGDPATTGTKFYYFRTTENSAMSIFDLNGHSAAFGGIDCQSYEQVTNRTSYTAYGAVTSDMPASLTLRTDAVPRWDPLQFRGAAGFRYIGTTTNLLVGVKSSSTGEFRVSSGVAGFDWGATWGGTNIVVDGTGTLYVGEESATAGVFGAASGAARSAALLTLGADGRLALAGGETAVLRAVRAGQPLARGVYCALDNAAAQAAGALGVSWIDGPGTLRILRNPKRAFCLFLR